MPKAVKLFARKFSPPVGADRGIALPHLTGSADAFLALSLGNLVLAITDGIPEAERLTADLRTLTDTPEHGAGDWCIREFPPALADDREAAGTRLKTLAALKSHAADSRPLVIVAPYVALVSPIPLDGVEPLVIEPESRRISFHELTDGLAELGYQRLPQVTEPGDYSVRGGIVDAWGLGEEFPVRAEFFGEDLESLRSFDPANQISIQRISSAEFLPAEENIAKNTQIGSIFSILPASTTVLALEHNSYSLSAILGDRPRNCGDRPRNSGDRPHDFRDFRMVYTGDPAPAGVPTYDFLTAPLPGFAELGAAEAHHPELFEAARKRLAQHLDAAERRGETICQIDALSGGFEIGDLIVVTKADRVFAKRHTVPTRSVTPRGARIEDFDELEPGEYVVHLDYGVGRFLGSSEITVDGRRSEVFTIEYADGGKLHVPASHAHLLSRYVGVKGEAVRLHRLDGKKWEKDKKDAQKAISDLAAALLETQARRETSPGFKYDLQCDGREAFDAAFPYDETDDQLTAIAAIEQDLASTKPMDRLICGDAGYGKTEVAMRAAFIAAMNGKQVAVLAPTTVLAEQHFETFTSRFDGTPIRIESVSRFQSDDTHRGTFQRLATGACDIVIGTHAILSSKIAFHDLGLIIVDEEQRFGVRHKEFLKRLRATADVLTLSATPIPRTLYLSMTGARDLSLLRTPPHERVAVDTKIVRDDDGLVKSAIEAELLRGGQVFFLHNRVNSIHTVEKRLRGLVPAARIVVAHGQMDSHSLARKMRAFEHGDFDLLLSTTIIESGIDIPRANTILVDQAHTFGMADLYQLRGRVGRSAREGHAYFLLPPSGIVDSTARERLAALKKHGGLGNGFNLAVRDLELRGAGNLLGSQQSGHIAAIGFGLYCQLLKRTIAHLKGEKVQEIIDVKLNLDFFTPQLPYEYIEEDALRISFLKRFAEAQEMRIIKALAAEMRDRFGPLPDAARDFVRAAEVRLLAARRGISRIDAANGRAVFYRADGRTIEKVIDLRASSVRSRLDQIANALKAEAGDNGR